MDTTATATGIAVGTGALIGALIWQLTSFVRRISASDWRGVKSQALTWLIGIIVIWLIASADLVNTFEFNGRQVSDLNAGSRIILGLMVTSLFAMVPFDFNKAIDNTNSAALPEFLPGVLTDTPERPSGS